MDRKLYFNCAKEGHKLDAITVDNRVSFCIMDEGFCKDGDWALNIRSVVVFGRLKMTNNFGETLKIVSQHGLKYYPTAESVGKEIYKAIAKVLTLELTIDHISGKLVNES